MTGRLYALVMSLFLLSIFTAQAGATLLEAPSGYGTIAAALGAASAGDTVLVAAGTYPESELTVPDGVVLHGATGLAEDVIVDAGGGDFVFLLQECGLSTHMAYLTITGATDNGLRVVAGAPHISDCVITGNTADMGGGVYLNSDEGLLERCVIIDNSAEFTGGGVMLLDSYATLDACIIARNESDTGAALYIAYGTSFLNGCTIVENVSTELDCIVFYETESLLTGCIVAFNDTPTTSSCSTNHQPSLSCNVIYGNMGGDELCGSDSGGNQVVDPGFCDLAGNDYGLYRESPCLPENNDCGVLIGALESGACNLPGDWVLLVPSEHATIAAAVAAAAPGDTIELAPGDYPVSVDLPPDLTLRGAWGDEPAVISGDGSGATVTIEGTTMRPPPPALGGLENLTITGGIAGGVRVIGADTRITDCVITGNSGTEGGGLYIESDGATLEDCLIVDNTATIDGGAVFYRGGTYALTGCTLAGNASPGGALACEDGTVSMSTGILALNESAAVSLGGTGLFSLSCSDLFGNQSDLNPGTDQGGNISLDPQFCDPAAGNYALGVDSPCLSEFNDCGQRMGALRTGRCEIESPDIIRVPLEHLTVGRALSEAAAGDTVWVYPGTYHERLVLDPGVILQSRLGADVTTLMALGDGATVTISGRRAPGAAGDTPAELRGFTITGGTEAGVKILSADPTIAGCVISGNSGLLGGGLDIQRADPTLAGCTISGNTATLGGAGAYLKDATGTWFDCRFLDNATDGKGGALHVDDSSPVLERCLLAGNMAASGGVLHGYPQFALPEFHGCTMVDNAASERGAVLYLYSRSQAVLDDCIVAYNDGPDLFHCYGTARPTVGGSILFGNTPGDSYCGLDDGGNLSVDPLFCDRLGGNYRLDAASPAMPAQAGRLIGALGLGCEGGVGNDPQPEPGTPALYATRLHGCAPNPFNPTTKVFFELAAPGVARLTVHDLRGRLVSVLVDEALDRGAHERTWNGRDDAGRGVGSGVYFVTLSAEGYRRTERVALLK